MNIPKVGGNKGSTNGKGPVLLRETDVRTGYLFLILLLASVVSIVLVVSSTDNSIYGVLPILATPFFVLGIVSYVVSRRWMVIIIALAVAAAAYLVGPEYALFILHLFICSEGVAVTVSIVQRSFFYRILSSVEGMNVKGRLNAFDRVVLFLFNIPPDVDTRRITMDTGIRRKGIPWMDMIRTMAMALVLCAFLWIYMFLDPAFRVQTDGLPVYTLTIILYIAALVMPWTVFSSLDVRITTDYCDFRLFDGLMETMKRMFLPAIVALVFLGVALSVGGYTFYYVLMSLAMIVLIVTVTSLMYYLCSEASVVKDVVSKWKAFHPADIDSGYGDQVGKVNGEFPGTPKRDPRSCFGRSGDQKY